MIEALESISALRAFVAAADNRSFKMAGQHLGISSSAVGKAIARMEGQLATTLFQRTTRTIVLTEPGALFLARARRMLEELEAGEAELAELSGDPRGRLRVSLPLSGPLFKKAITVFAQANPHVELEIDYSDRLVNVVDEGFDVVVRTGATGDSRLLRRVLGTIEWQLAAAPSYLRRRGQPTIPQDLRDHVCLRQKSATGRIAPWTMRSAPGFAAPVNLTVSVIDPLFQLVLDGTGIGCFPRFMVRDAISDGSLVPVLDNEIQQTGTLTMLWPAARFRIPKVRSFIDIAAMYVRP
jgi:DNA-binding transcriptional LysR family regulator